MRQFIGSGIVGLWLALAPLAALAAGGSWSSGGDSDELDRAERMISAQRYDEAISILQGVVADDTDNADAYNWLGYAHRQLGRYDEAVAHYEQALAIDPDHLGALEYLGEAYLAMDDLGGAEAMLARLDSACWFGCEELDELEAAIAEYRGQRESN